MADERNALLLNLHDIGQFTEVPFRYLVLEVFRNFAVLGRDVLERLAGFSAQFASQLRNTAGHGKLSAVFVNYLVIHAEMRRKHLKLEV